MQDPSPFIPANAGIQITSSAHKVAHQHYLIRPRRLDLDPGIRRDERGGVI